MGTKHVGLNPRRKDKYNDYIDWREVTGSGIISVQEAAELEDQLRRYMDATVLKREAEDILGNSYKPGLSKELVSKLTSLGITKLGYMGMRFAVQAGRQSRVSPELLLAHGVSPDVVQACTETTEYEFIVMRKGEER